MALTEIYVDPSIAADSGAGTVGDPYGDLEYCVEQEDYDTTNGIQVNIKAGTAEVLAADLSVAMADTAAPGKSVAWSPSAAAPLVFRGYTTAANDGGIGAIDQNAADSLQLSAYNYVSFIDMELYNAGAGVSVVRVGQYCSFQRVHAHGCDNRGIYTNVFAFVQGCYVHDCGSRQIEVSSSSVVRNNLVTNTGTRTCSEAIHTVGNGCVVDNNIISIDSTSDGVGAENASTVCANSIYSAAGSGTGIDINATSDYIFAVQNNLIEGFSDTGGIGINLTQVNTGCHSMAANSIYNCATEVNAPNYNIFDWDTANESLSASPFTSASTGDFSPVDTGEVKEGSIPPFWTV